MKDREAVSAPPRRPTLKTVAAEVGLAVATVSRALNDAPDINEETKARVREAALRVGYRPNRAGVRLRTGRTNVISLLLAPETDMMSHTARLIHALASELRGTPYHLIVTPVFDDEDPLAQVRYVIETGSADAIVINKIRPEDPRIAYMHANRMPFATHGRSDMGIAHPFFDFDNRRYAELAVEALAARGRRRLLVVAPPIEQNYAQHIVAGVEATCARLGLGWRRVEDATSDSPSARIEAAVARRLAGGGCDAVLCASAASVIASVSAAEGLGLRLGADLDVAGKESVPFLKRFRSEIIAVHEDSAAAGAFLARAALAAVRDPSAPPMTHLAAPGPGDLR